MHTLILDLLLFYRRYILIFVTFTDEGVESYFLFISYFILFIFIFINKIFKKKVSQSQRNPHMLCYRMHVLVTSSTQQY